MNKESIQKRVLEEEDYVRCPKCSNSLNKFIARNSDGVKNAVIARLLLIPEEQVEQLYQEAVVLLQKEMKKEDE